MNEPISNLQIYDLSKSLTSQNAALEILANFLPVVNQVKFNENRMALRSEDRIAKPLILLELKDFAPITTTGDGNCLFNAVSILSGDENLAGILRLQTVAELFAHSDFYANHPHFPAASQTSGYAVSTLLSIFLSDDKAQAIFNGSKANAYLAIECLASVSAKPFIFESPYHILALASMIGKPIQSVYPNIPTSRRIRIAIQGIFFPIQIYGNDSAYDTRALIRIMWSRTASSPIFNWQPNHFVPLINKSSTTLFSPPISYADAAKSMKKTASKKSLPTMNYEESLKAIPTTLGNEKLFQKFPVRCYE